MQGAHKQQLQENPRITFKKSLRKKAIKKKLDEIIQLNGLSKEDINMQINPNELNIRGMDFNLLNNIDINGLLNSNSQDLLLFWIYHLRTTSTEKDSNSNFLSSLDDSKIRLLLDILLRNFPNDPQSIQQSIKIKYEICIILINLLAETNVYNQIFIQYINRIFKFLLALLSQINQNSSPIVVLITHLNWLISNIITDIKSCMIIIHMVNFAQLIQNLFDFNKELKDINLIQTTLWILNQFLNVSNKESFINYKGFLNYICYYLKISIGLLNISSIKNCFESIHLFTKSPECCQYLLFQISDNNQNVPQDDFIIKAIINYYQANAECRYILAKLIDEDKQCLIESKFGIFNNLIINYLNNYDPESNIEEEKIFVDTLDLFSQSIVNYTRAVNIQHFQVFFDSNNSNIITKIINLSANENLKYKKIIFRLLYRIFDNGEVIHKNMMFNMEIHLAVFNQLKILIDQKSTQRTNDEKYLNLILLLLKFLSILFKAGENNQLGINIVIAALSNDDILGLLTQINMEFDSPEIIAMVLKIEEEFFKFGDNI